MPRVSLTLKYWSSWIQSCNKNSRIVADCELSVANCTISWETDSILQLLTVNSVFSIIRTALPLSGLATGDYWCEELSIPKIASSLWHVFLLSFITFSWSLSCTGFSPTFFAIILFSSGWLFFFPLKWMLELLFYLPFPWLFLLLQQSVSFSSRVWTNHFPITRQSRWGCTVSWFFLTD